MINVIEKNYLFAANTLTIVLASVLGAIIVGLLLFVIITKLKKRDKKVENKSKISDYQFEFKLNTGHFINKLKEMQEAEENKNEQN